MRLRLQDVLERAHQRGYTAEEIRPCLVRDLGGGWFDVDVEHAAYPRTPRIESPPSRGLGDFVAAGLALFGITKERVSALAGGDCGCSQRQQAMNEWGKKHLGIG